MIDRVRIRFAVTVWNKTVEIATETATWSRARSLRPRNCAWSEIGKIEITGIAVANAVYNATGQRIRDLPITLDKLIWGAGWRFRRCRPKMATSALKSKQAGTPLFEQLSVIRFDLR